MTDEELLTAFESATVRMEDWTHRAHVRVAYLYLREGDVEAALTKMRGHLEQLLVAFSIEDGLERGYHETVTVAWLRIVRSAMETYGPYDTFDALLEGHPHLLDKRLLRLFYSRAGIVTEEAKRRFVDGDLAQLPSG